MRFIGPTWLSLLSCSQDIFINRQHFSQIKQQLILENIIPRPTSWDPNHFPNSQISTLFFFFLPIFQPPSFVLPWKCLFFLFCVSADHVHPSRYGVLSYRNQNPTPLHRQLRSSRSQAGEMKMFWKRDVELIIDFVKRCIPVKYKRPLYLASNEFKIENKNLVKTRPSCLQKISFFGL